MMCDKLVGGIGVVNSVGVLIGGISIRAIAQCAEGDLQANLKKPVGDFLNSKLVEGCDVDVLAVRYAVL